MRNLFLIGMCCACWLAEGAGTGRAVWVGTNAVSLGTYPSGEERSVRFKIRNAGAGPLRLGGVVLTCACLRVDGYPAEIAAGETGEVAVTVKKNELSGSFKSVFYVRTDDPAQGLARAEVCGYAKPLFLVTCDAKTKLGPVEEGQVWTGRYEVVATEPGVSLGSPSETNRGTRSESVVAAHAAPCMAYAVTRVVTFEGKGILESEMTLPVVGEGRSGAVPVRLSVCGSRRPNLQIVPSRIKIGVEEREATRHFLILIDDQQAPDKALLGWRSPLDGVEVLPSPSKSGRGFMVEVRFSQAYTEALKKVGLSELVLHYRNVDEISIAVRCE